MSEFIKVLDIHPKVKGFQILNDNGVHLISGYAGYQAMPENGFPTPHKDAKAFLRFLKSGKVRQTVGFLDL